MAVVTLVEHGRSGFMMSACSKAQVCERAKGGGSGAAEDRQGGAYSFPGVDFGTLRVYNRWGSLRPYRYLVAYDTDVLQYTCCLLLFPWH